MGRVQDVLAQALVDVEARVRVGAVVAEDVEEGGGQEGPLVVVGAMPVCVVVEGEGEGGEAVANVLDGAVAEGGFAGSVSWGEESWGG